MAKVHYNLRNPKEDSTLIYLILRPKKGTRIRYNTGYQVNPDFWDSKLQETKNDTQLNQKLRQLKTTAEKLVKHLGDSGKTISTNTINKLLPQWIDGQHITVASDFLGYYKNFKDNWIKTKGYDTAKNFQTSYNKVVEYDSNLNWNDLDYSFYLDFISYLESKGYSKNYIGKIINNLKIVLSYATKEGYNKNESFKHFKKLAEKVDHIYYSEKELVRWENKSFVDKKLDDARDLFLVGCNTGMRVGNYAKIDPDININLRKNQITVIVNKNGPKVTIPINKTVKAILDKRGGKLPVVREQDLNKLIKAAAFQIGFTENFLFAKTVGGKRIQYNKQKWELTTTHTARRSFATNAIKKKEPIYSIMLITGHQDIKQFLQYICLSPSEASALLSTGEFFK